MAHHRNDKLSSMVSPWMRGIIHRRNYLIDERNKPYMMTLFLSPEDDFMALTSMFENRFLSWLRAKPPFHLEMSRPRHVPLTALFKSCVHLLMNIGMKKEALEKKHLSLRNRMAKLWQCDSTGLKRLKPTSHMGLAEVDWSRQGCGV